jgi:hypothetical protein
MTTFDARDQGRPRARGRKGGRASGRGAGGDVIGPGESLTGCATRLGFWLAILACSLVILVAVAGAL